MTPGRLSQFVLYAVFAAAGLGQLSRGLGRALAGRRRGRAAVRDPERASRRSCAPARPVALPEPRARRGRLRRMSASPIRRGRRASVLDGVSFRVRPGEKVAIVGPSGAGKSTIFHLILRFYDPDVRHDHASTACRSPTPTRSRCAGASRWCRRTPSIFAASIARQHPLRPAGRERRRGRARGRARACASEFIGRLPQGFDTPVGERGVTLSGGQRQRIAIARAILRDAPLLLLDEATSSLDAESETLVQAALERLMADRTTLVIAHRLATVLSCDRILVMDAGPHRRGRHARAARRRRRPLRAAGQAAVPERLIARGARVASSSCGPARPSAS